MARFVLCYGLGRVPSRFNDGLHLGFFERALRDYGHEAVDYGPPRPGEKTGPLPYDPTRTARDVMKELDGDVYLHMEGWRGTEMLSTLPSSVPSIGYVVDWHRARYRNWVSMPDVLFYRAQAFRESLVEHRPKKSRRTCVFLPFSVDEKAISSLEQTEERERRVLFVGAARVDDYPMRKRWIPKLRKEGLLAKGSSVSPAYDHKKYLQYIRDAAAAFACTGTLGLPHAKHLEIAACGTLLFTDGHPCLDALLPRGSYVAYGNRDVVDLSRRWLDSKQDDKRNKKAQVARRHVLAHHTHAVRARQMLKHLDDLGIVKTSLLEVSRES